MRRSLAFAVLPLAALSLAVTSSAGKPPAIKEVPVAVTIADGYSIESDGYGPYANGVAGVKAVFVSAGNLALTTGSARALSLDFTGTCTGPCSPPWPSGVVTGFVSTSACDNTGGLRDMPIPSSQSCNLNVNFGTPGTGWFIRFGEYDGTTPATVDRLADGSWVVEVPADGVARLQSYPSKGRMVLTDRGDWVMGAQLTVTLLP